MKDLGIAKKILRMRINQDKVLGTLMLLQAKYISKVVDRFNMKDAKLVIPPLDIHLKLSKGYLPKNYKRACSYGKCSICFNY